MLRFQTHLESILYRVRDRDLVSFFCVWKSNLRKNYIVVLVRSHSAQNRHNSVHRTPCFQKDWYTKCRSRSQET